MPQDDPTEESIFALALEKLSPAERAAFVEAACVGHPTLLERVEGLLRSHEEAGDFLQSPLAPATETFGPGQLSETPGSRIGPYKLLQQIGEGGMGVVYMAEQESPVRRKVALKIIKPGMDSAQVVARFEAERQALAMMDHQNIARVLDAGTTGSGRPYFVMELVHGVPITQYCDANHLTPRERLELFIPVCQAIQHAHQKGIIHRDIKPSNVLVTMYDDRPVPKVIDFGVAKAIEQSLTERTLFTQYGALVGTFEYMSPEQAELNAFGVDTRSDVFSLGVLLYELLTGTTPLEKQRLRQAALSELVRLIKEEEPPRPSVRLSGSGDLPKIAAARKTEPARLSKLVRGEVDWIVMKCLEKDRTRRYQTANALARDVERHLKDEPVEACPPSTGYLLQKFTRKYRMPMAITACFAMLLLAGVVASTWQASRAKRAEREAVAHATEAAASERKAVIATEAARAEQVEAETARQSLRRSLYASDIQLAQAAWASGRIVRMQELLEAHRPRPGEADLRGFEWHYLRRLGSHFRAAKYPFKSWGTMSPDGTRYVSAEFRPSGRNPNTKDLEFRLGDMSTGRELRSYIPFPGETLTAYKLGDMFSPDGKRFLLEAGVRDATGRSPWRIKAWEWDTGRELCTLANLEGTTVGTAFDQAGRRLALVMQRAARPEETDLVVKVREVDGGKELLTIPLPGRQVVNSPYSIAFSPDATRLAALTGPSGPGGNVAPGEVRIWDASTGQEFLRFAVEAASNASRLDYSPDGRWLAVAAVLEGSLSIWDAGSGRKLGGLAKSDQYGMLMGTAFSPDGLLLAASFADGKVRIWDLKMGQAEGIQPPSRLLEGNHAALRRVAFSPDGRSVSASDRSGTVLTWRLAAPEKLTVVPGPVWDSGPDGPATSASADASRFAAPFRSNGGATEVKAWDAAGNVFFAARDETIPDVRSSSWRSANLSAGGERLAYWALDATKERFASRLRAWEIGTGKELFRLDGDRSGYFHSSTLNHDGRLLAASWVARPDDSESKPSRVYLWDLSTGEERLRIDVPFWADLAFSPDGRRLAGALIAGGVDNFQSEIRVCDAATGEVVLSRKWPEGWISTPTFSRDGMMLAVQVGTRGASGPVKLLDVSTGKELHSLDGHRFNGVLSLAFSPDGRRLASASYSPDHAEAEVKLWDVSGGRELLTLPANGRGRLAFSADGHRLSYVSEVGVSRDAGVHAWDATPLTDTFTSL
jgi:eukaryotic-like serine/threonine-protein kinase